jgi:branched-chain amino acid aminotransferase
VAERPISLDELRADVASGRIREFFACGTAAVITPIGLVRSSAGDFAVADGGTGPVTAHLRQSLMDIQRGRAEDRYGWVRRVL